MSNEPVINLPFLYLNGMLVSNDATTPNTIIDVAAGQCRDSTNSYDIILGNYLGINPNQTANTVTKINASINGLNGLDTGTFAANTLYYVYVIADPSGFKPTGCVISTALPSVGPLMPFGYGIYRCIGAWATDNTTHFLLGYMSGANTGDRVFTYDAPQATAVTAGNANAYTAVDLSAFVPAFANIRVNLQYNFNANAAADTLKIQPLNGTGDTFTVIAQVAGATAHLEGQQMMVAQLTAGNKPEVNYKVSAGAVALNVAGFAMNL